MGRVLCGKTLAQVLKEEESPNSLGNVDILLQCCEALAHVHIKELVHRDIKPSNIFLSQAENGTGLVKIVDCTFNTLWKTLFVSVLKKILQSATTLSQL
jgi:serine/threonine protein kinase